MKKPKRLGQKAEIYTKNMTGYYITRDYSLYLKSFKQSLSVNATTTLWQVILISIKPKILFTENTIGQAFEEILRSILKSMTYP